MANGKITIYVKDDIFTWIHYLDKIASQEVRPVSYCKAVSCQSIFGPSGLSKALSQALESPSRLGRLEARKQESDCILIYLTHSIAQEARKPEGWKVGKLRKLESLGSRK